MEQAYAMHCTRPARANPPNLPTGHEELGGGVSLMAFEGLNSDEKVANRDVRDSGWEVAHAAVSRRTPISLDTMVPRTEGYTYDASVWDLSIVQGPFSVAPCQTLTLRFATFFIGVGRKGAPEL
jgi:hypothetical protein